MCCPTSPLLADGDAEFDLRVRGLLLRLAGEGKTGICPRTPFIVSRTCKPKPAGRAAGNLFREPFTRASFRLLSIRAPRQAVLRTSSWLAPSDHHPALQPEGREDTRYDQPMSATHTKLRAPAPRAFSARSRHFRGGDTPRSLGLRDVRLRDRVFHDTRDRFGGSSSGTNPALYCLTAWSHERGRCLPTVPTRSSL